MPNKAKNLSFWIRDHCIPRRWQQVGFVGCFVIIALSWILGIWTAEYPERGIFEKFNWLGYPLWWLILGCFLHFSHTAFDTAWSRLATQGVIARSDGTKLDSKGIKRLLELLPHNQKSWFVAAMLIGLVLTTVDALKVTEAYIDCGSSVTTVTDELKVCKDEQDFFTAFDALGSYLPEEAARSAEKGIAFKMGNGVLTLLAYILQGGLIGMAFLVLFNLSTNQYILGRTGRDMGWGPADIRIFIDGSDPLRELGLFEWNKVLNWSYVFIAVAMIIPFVSHASQPEGLGLNELIKAIKTGGPDIDIKKILENLNALGSSKGPNIGQLLLQVLLPLIFLVPLGLALISRQGLVDNAKRELARNLNFADESQRLALEEQFHNQTLWPFDRDLIGKAAFAIIIIEYAFVASNAPAVIQGFLKAQAAAGTFL